MRATEPSRRVGGFVFFLPIVQGACARFLRWEMAGKLETLEVLEETEEGEDDEGKLAFPAQGRWAKWLTRSNNEILIAVLKKKKYNFKPFMK